MHALSYSHSLLQFSWYICNAVDNTIKKTIQMLIFFGGKTKERKTKTKEKHTHAKTM